MTKGSKKDLATSLTTLVFIVIAVSGVMMFFHVFDSYVKSLHEILGLFFILAVMFHVIFNWKSMKNYFNKKTFVSSALALSAVSLSFVLTASGGENPKMKIIKSVIDSPIERSFALLGSDMAAVKTKLASNGITIENANSIGEIAKQNKTSPFEIVNVIVK